MIVRRIALFVALLFGLALTQVPEFVEQYRQRLGGAIDELAAVVARVDADSAQHGLTQSGAIDRLHANPDQLARERADAILGDVARLASLRDAQAAFRSEGPVARLATFATHYDTRIARGAYADYEPAVPASPEAFVLGLVGFLFGGSVVHMTGRQMRRPRAVSRTTAA